MKRANRFLLVMIVLSILLAGCATSAAEQPEPTPEPTNTSIPPTPTAIPTTATPRPTPTIFVPITGKVDAFSLNLRSGPSTIHAVSGTFPQGTGLSIIGIAPGLEWVKVELADLTTGWMSISMVNLDGEPETLPIVQPEESLLVTGRVLGSDGLPISDIKISVFQGFGETQKFTDTITTDDGTFYAYLPNTSEGEWTVQIIGYRCSSRIVEDNCQYSGIFLDNGIAAIELPQSMPIEFVYEFPTTE